MANSDINEQAPSQVGFRYVSGRKRSIGSVRFINGILGNFTGSWTLEKFSSLGSNVGESHWSKVFLESEGMEWQLRIYPGGLDEASKGFVSCTLEGNTDYSVYGAQVKYVMSFGNVEGDKIEEWSTNEWKNMCYKESWCMKDIIKRETLISRLTDDTLVIHVHASFSLTSWMDGKHRYFKKELSSFAELVEGFASLYEKNKMSDAVISVGGSEFDVHRAVLASRSDVFAGMLSGDGKDDDGNDNYEQDYYEQDYEQDYYEQDYYEEDYYEDSDDEPPTKRKLEIDGFEPSTVKLMLEFLYTGSAHGINHSNGTELLRIADKYGLDDLKQFCSNILTCHLNTSNLIDTFVIAEKTDAVGLKKNALAFYYKNRFSIKLKKHRAVFEQHPDILYDIINELIDPVMTAFLGVSF